MCYSFYWVCIESNRSSWEDWEELSYTAKRMLCIMIQLVYSQTTLGLWLPIISEHFCFYVTS